MRVYVYIVYRCSDVYVCSRSHRCCACVYAVYALDPYTIYCPHACRMYVNTYVYHRLARTRPWMHQSSSTRRVMKAWSSLSSRVRAYSLMTRITVPVTSASK